MCSTTTLYHLLDSLALSPTGTALLNIGDLSYAGAPAVLQNLQQSLISSSLGQACQFSCRPA